MFRNKEFLISKGMYENCRGDVFFIVGSMYDEVVETGVIDEKRYEELRNYLIEHRKVINNKDYPIALYESIVKRFKEMEIDGECVSKSKEEENDDISKCRGIYGIYVNNTLVYIGRTVESFKERFNSHKSALKNDENTRLYKYLNTCKKNGSIITLKPLVILEKLRMEHKKTINIKELNCMELALITALKPKLNIEGVSKPYVFRNY